MELASSECGASPADRRCGEQVCIWAGWYFARYGACHRGANLTWRRASFGLDNADGAVVPRSPARRVGSQGVKVGDIAWGLAACLTWWYLKACDEDSCRILSQLIRSGRSPVAGGRLVVR
jgi:hypothetical protein